MMLMIKKVPRNLQAAFKARCAILGITMREKIISMMREACKSPLDQRRG
jgi:hypothetical protein